MPRGLCGRQPRDEVSCQGKKLACREQSSSHRQLEESYKEQWEAGSRCLAISLGGQMALRETHLPQETVCHHR